MALKEPSRWNLLGTTAAAGVLAGGCAGLLEAVLLTTLSGNPGNAHALLWAVLGYGVVGLVAGLAIGFVLALMWPKVARQSAYAFAWAAVFAGLGFFVTRYRLYRDLYHESIRTFSLQGLIFNGGMLVAFVGLFFLLLWLWRRPGLVRVTKTVASLTVFVLLVAVAAALSFATRPVDTLATAPSGIPPGLESTPNVILIGADTLRADRVSSYGYAGSETPRIDELAADGVRYQEMTAQASWTKPSFATIFTSLYPSSHTATGKPHSLPQAVTTLAEVLAASGYHTGGFADNPSISASFGFDQGFADYIYLEPSYLFGGSESASQIALYQILRRGWAMASGARVYPQHFYQDAAGVNEQALAWLEANRSTRFFLFLHYMDPHDPYFEHPYNGIGYARASDQNPDPSMAPTFSARYDGEVRYLDDHLGMLFDWLKGQGLYDDALIVLTADHGEEFQEHGGWWHGQTLYQEQIAVPLIVKYPQGARQGEVVSDLTRSLDIAPTILDAAGVAVPEAMMGRSLWTASESPAFAFAEEDHEGNVLQSLRTQTRKLILANPDNPRGLPSESLFALDVDPGEQANLLPGESDGARVLRDALRQVLVFALERAVAGEMGAIDAGVQEQLRDLGY